LEKDFRHGKVHAFLFCPEQAETGITACESQMQPINVLIMDMFPSLGWVDALKLPYI
jgi:hypothetical protein